MRFQAATEAFTSIGTTTLETRESRDRRYARPALAP
jgi:hypothetical protein